jgi:hypothetical protein
LAATGRAHIDRFVEEVLNEHRSEVVPEIFAGHYVDYDPPAGFPRDRTGVIYLARMLAQPGTDLRFTIERCVEVGTGAVWVALFGEGTVVRRAVVRDGIVLLQLWPIEDPWAPERSEPHRFHLIVSTAAVFEIGSRGIERRWGPMRTEWSDWGRYAAP